MLHLRIGPSLPMVKLMFIKINIIYSDLEENSLVVKRIAIREKEFDNCQVCMNICIQCQCFQRSSSNQEMFLDRSRLHRKGYQHRVTRIVDKMMVIFVEIVHHPPYCYFR